MKYIKNKYFKNSTTRIIGRVSKWTISVEYCEVKTGFLNSYPWGAKSIRIGFIELIISGFKKVEGNQLSETINTINSRFK